MRFVALSTSAIIGLMTTMTCAAAEPSEPPSITPKIAPIVAAVLQPFIGTLLQAGVGWAKDKVNTTVQGTLGSMPIGDQLQAPLAALGSSIVDELGREAMKRIGAGGSPVGYPAFAMPAQAQSPVGQAATPTQSLQPSFAPVEVMQQPAVPVQGSLLSLTPGFSYTIDLLDGNTPANVVARLPLDRGAPTIRTGDRFAVRFMTNLPGLVKIENVDATNVRSDLGVYAVFPGADSRVPRDLGKGIRMIGTTGIETFNVRFYPCVTDEARARLGMQAAWNTLPACPGAYMAAQVGAGASFTTAVLTPPAEGRPTQSPRVEPQVLTTVAPTPLKPAAPVLTPAQGNPPATSNTQSSSTQAAMVADRMFELIQGKGVNIVPRAAMNEEIVGQNTLVTVANNYQAGQTMQQQFQLHHIPK